MPVTGTYRLQLHRDFGFADAERTVPYLARLGVSHLYLSPILQAVPGSMHGYDVIDHTRLSDDLGGRDAFDSLVARAHAAGIGLIVDVVPNHMAFTAPETGNAPLWQVLRDGRDAPTASWFDIDWKAGGGRLGLPILGDDLDTVLGAGQIALDRAVDPVLGHEIPALRYFEHVLPVTIGTTGEAEPGASDAATMRAILDRQHYRLTSWRDADAALNYRRFFAVAELIAVRVEEPEVFDATHALLLELNHAGAIDGFRIDHPDGLADPAGYLERLRRAARPGTYVVVEKILEGDERLPTTWRCDGTTGYDAAKALSEALVDPAAAPVLDEAWALAGGDAQLHAAVEDAKRQIVDELLTPEAERLVRRAREALPGRDPARLREAVVELLVAGEVYRAYVRPDQKLTDEARGRLRDAFTRAAARRPDLVPELGDLIPLTIAGDGSDFAVRLQQTWGPVMAKSIEDTTFYRWNRLIALNEVGGDPLALEHGMPEALHAWAAAQASDWPRGMTTLSTHDTKRSEDVRARLLAVAGDPEAWATCSRIARERASDYGVDLPTAHLLWQTMLGVGPISDERMHGYLIKAVREAAQHTAWIDGDPEYESRVEAFVTKVRHDGPLHEAIEGAVARNAEAVRATVLAQKALQLTMPGVPDTYQGCEIVDLSLVDPDNRRPVDFSARDALLTSLDAGTDAWRADLDAAKLLVTSRVLRLRRERPDAFAGGYAPLTTSSEHALGFVREASGGLVGRLGLGRRDRLATLVTRAPARLAASGGWQDATVELPPGSWADVLTGRAVEGGTVRVAEALADLPVAVLVQPGAGR